MSCFALLMEFGGEGLEGFKMDRKINISSGQCAKAVRCIADNSIFCPFPFCIAESIESCNERSGRFRRVSRGVDSVNFAVLRGSKFVELRGRSSF